MIFTKGIFRQKALRFDLPGKIDEPFYLDVKNRIANDPKFQFESEVNLWELYSGLLVLSLLTCLAVICLFVLIVFHLLNAVLLVICFGIIVIGMRPAIYFGMLLFHFLKYRRDEKRFHSEFSRVITQSENFPDFTNRFYSGDYSETTMLKAFFLTLPIDPIRDFAESKRLTSNLCIYKRAKGDNYIVLSNNVELIGFLKDYNGIVPVEPHDPVWRIVKEQLEYPYVYGNRRLKHLID